ncbi:FbpB family small basic protein [Bacillus aerolatus]|uniref:FbpB family small basic protein n=1 Tax=Bacillus aerolatus TaxID=2653354 RepID=A0A6I1FI12_9BACI|nr:FbpB family small basic protein [Bacillus aerolatus]KAB7705294.1 FbpB family small basic protein [Bacillus aerolatus]
MKKKHLSFHQLIEKNKEEMLKDKSVMEKIEKKLDKKHTDFMKRQQVV